jgi:hypothetical protein
MQVMDAIARIPALDAVGLQLVIACLIVTHVRDDRKPHGFLVQAFAPDERPTRPLYF